MASLTDTLSIGSFAKTCGVSTPTVRYYEKIDLLPKADRTRSDQRRYGADDVKRLSFIRRCRAFGFSTKQVKVLLSVPDGSASDCQVSRDIAEQRVTEIHARVLDLLALEKDLKALIASCDATCGTQKDRVCDGFKDMQPRAD